MLEFPKILRDIDALGRERAESFAEIPEQMGRAERTLTRMGEDVEGARARIEGAKTSWLLADFDEDPRIARDPVPLPPQHAVVASDGSQIVPGKHDVTFCYLLNASYIILYYGNCERPVARTIPKLFYREEDLVEDPYGGKRMQVNEKLLGMKRTIEEARAIEQAIRAARASGIPTVALWDGSLIRWTLENEPADYRDRTLEEYLKVFDTAREMGVPIAGYISDPGSRDLCNCVKVMLCDQEPIDCDRCSHKAAGEIPPCEGVGRLKDSSLFKERLRGGKRSVLFGSRSSILDRYREHRVGAFYVDAGLEVVRIEVPEWVASDVGMMDLVHGVCLDQAVKGRGYPIALSEAHEHAVIHGADRKAFYEMVERSFLKHGAKITYSLKRISKGY